MVNAKSKGNTYERTVSNLLSKRFQEYTGLEKAFRRNIDSGSFFGGRNAMRTESHDLSKATFGDIVCPDNFKFGIECKHYKSPPSLISFLSSGIKDWDKWIAQAEDDANHDSKSFLLIIKYNNTKEIAITNTPLNVGIVHKYKNYFVTTLDNLLNYPNEFFFE